MELDVCKYIVKKGMSPPHNLKKAIQNHFKYSLDLRPLIEIITCIELIKYNMSRDVEQLLSHFPHPQSSPPPPSPPPSAPSLAPPPSPSISSSLPILPLSLQTATSSHLPSHSHLHPAPTYPPPLIPLPSHSSPQKTTILYLEQIIKTLEKIKTEKTCKICMNAGLEIVFLPCTHMISCSSCISSLKYCPICRSDIIYIIKPIIS
ncbi:Baculoviral IAP repeat-containing protein 3 [Astathelohania contejeani]|uniref:Baculoviral IAP repeat-containing protein 3 n=1 Tax=Astathelohania contejeani TaxID=164912 RepID=A0ABQ7HVC0_9MICR|nr:Baculoviral IAP repeat-containing protein 3 [Thelohania contejeani]